jgi:hypothetical protein
VSLEFRARTALELARLLNQHASQYLEAVRLLPKPAENREAGAGTGPDLPMPALPAGSEDSKVVDSESAETEAKAMAAEFYGEFPEGPEGWTDPEAPEPAEPLMPRRRSETNGER